MNVAESGIEVAAIDTPTLGDRSYLAHDGKTALVIDPQRDIDRLLHDLPARLGDVPAGEVWVHCGAGYRAAVAASFLDAADRTVVAVDEEFEHAAKAGLPTT